MSRNKEKRTGWSHMLIARQIISYMKWNFYLKGLYSQTSVCATGNLAKKRKTYLFRKEANKNCWYKSLLNTIKCYNYFFLSFLVPFLCWLKCYNNNASYFWTFYWYSSIHLLIYTFLLSSSQILSSVFSTPSTTTCTVPKKKKKKMVCICLAFDYTNAMLVLILCLLLLLL